MKKNVASQVVGTQMIATADGSAFTGSVTVYVTKDGGTQTVGSVGSGAATSKGNGYYEYSPSQAETNADYLSFTFVGTGAVPATICGYTFFPQTVDMATAPTDWLSSAAVSSAAVTKIQNGLATPTNITAGTLTTVTNLTNLPAIPAGWLTAAGIAASALNGKGDWSTYAGGDTSGVTTLLSRLTSGRAGNLDFLDVSVASRLATSGYTAPSNATIASIASAQANQALASQIPANFTAGLFASAGVFSVGALQNAPAGGGGSGASAAAIADAICDELLSEHTIPGSAAMAWSIASAGGLVLPGSVISSTITSSPRAASVLGIVQSFCKRKGLPVPTTLIGSRDSQIIQIVELLQYVHDELARDYRWECAVYESTFTTVNGSPQGSMDTLAPYGFIGIINQTIFNRTRRLPLYGPMNEEQWQRLKALPNPGPYYKYRIQGNTLKFLPDAIENEICSFEYTSSYLLVDSDGINPHETLTSDGDRTLLDKMVIGTGLEARWLEAVGMDWVGKYQEFRRLADAAKARDAGKPIVSLTGPAETVQPGVFVPTGSWSL